LYDGGGGAAPAAELRKALSLNPDHPEWHFNLGLTLEAAGRDAEAISSYEQAIELMPDQREPLVAAAHAANRLNQPDKAVKWFDRALAMDVTHEEAYAGKIEAHLRKGEHDEAETTFYLAQQALEAPSARCLAVMAESLIQRKQWERAHWCLREALRLEPTMPRLRSRLANVLTSMGRTQRAMQWYLDELRDDPGSIETLLDFGELLIELDRLPEAVLLENEHRLGSAEPVRVEQRSERHFSERSRAKLRERRKVGRLHSDFLRCAL
jgi:tetratricopeptide (TPR) repeat protein